MQNSEVISKLPALHARLTEMLSVFADICKKNNLRYYMIGGTALGAVRHKGFIPWDDDIDIGMPRKDYETFLKIANNELPAYYEIRNFKTNPNGHVYPWTKVEDNRTSLMVYWTRHLNYISGIFIDLFPLDGCPSNKTLLKIHASTIFFLKKILMYSYVNRERRDTTFIKYYIWKLINRHFTRNVIYNGLHWLLKLYSYDKSEYIGNFFGEYEYREIMPKSYFGEGCQLQFGERYFQNPVEPELYLRHVYGDNFMDIPPKEKQISMHEFYMLELDRPNH